MTTTTPQSAAPDAARDKYHVYRPLLDLIGHAEGTDRKRGYNETLAYGAFTGGDVDLVAMTLEAIDALQTRMLKHPDNRERQPASWFDPRTHPSLRGPAVAVCLRHRRVCAYWEVSSED